MKVFLTIFFLFLSTISFAKPAHHCSGDAVKRAKKLLEFHYGPDEGIGVGDEAKLVSSIRNPANKKQRFDVLEVWGFIYKGEYRMHFIYAQIKDSCVLMGQEILEFASI